MITPCRGICRLNPEQVCEGCGRTLDEIARWTSMTDEERADVMRRMGVGEVRENISMKKM